MERRLGEYVIERELARGGAGAVFLARHAELGRQVALKLLHTPTGKSLQRFQTEALALAKLRHPHIVTVHDVDLSGETPFLAMRYVAGRSLADRLREGPLPLAEAAAIVRDLAGAVAHAHAQGILHRDIKPGNVLLSAEEGPLLADFGLARELSDERERLTLSGQLVGTPAYMPPEQAIGDHAAIGPASDVYALGATLYHALTGDAPFDRPTLMGLIAAVTQEPPPPIAQLRPEAAGALAAICARCLAKAPADRYPSAEALADDLGRYLAGEPVEACSTRRPRWPLALAALGLVALLALLAARLGPRAEPAPLAASPRATAPPASPSPSPPAGPAELSDLEGRPFLLRARRWLETNPADPQASALRRRYVQVGLQHPLHVTGPREVDPHAAWFVPIGFAKRKRTQILTVERGRMAFDLWDPRTRERLRRYGRADYVGQLGYDRGRNAAKGFDPSGQVHEWMLNMLDFEHNRWFVRDAGRKGRAWTERPARWVATPKKSHMTLAFTDGWIDLHEEHEQTLLARLPQPGPVAAMGWTPDARWLVTTGLLRQSVMRGYLRAWDIRSPARTKPVQAELIGTPRALAIRPGGEHVALAVSNRIELRAVRTLRVVSVFIAADVQNVRGARSSHTANVQRLAFAPDGARLYSYAEARGHGELRAWSVRGEQTALLAVHRAPRLRVRSLDVSPTSDQLLAVTEGPARRRLSLFEVAVPRPAGGPK